MAKEELTKAAMRRLVMEHDMHPSVKREAKVFEDFFQREADRNLQAAYDLGCMVAAADQKIGPHGVDEMAKYLGQDACRLYQLKNLTERFPRERFATWAKDQFDNGQYLTVDHLILLKGLFGDEFREFFARTYRESLTPRQLAAAINKARKARRERCKLGMQQQDEAGQAAEA